MTEQKIKITECPRDAMQGWPHQIVTDKKVAYLNQLLQVGFDVLDCVSFVSPKAIPQMADSAQVLPQLQLSGVNTKLLAIIANLRGAQEAVAFEQLTFLGFPFSISETFQQRNTNKSITESLKEVEAIQKLCVQHGKELLIYISMGFGNPYGDPYNADVAIDWVSRLEQTGIQHFSMSDTIGIAQPDTIAYIFSHLNKAFPHLKIGAHFHSTPFTRLEKLDAAWANGCRNFDSAIKGIGGCPMAKEELVGNMETETLLDWAAKQSPALAIDRLAFDKSVQMASEVFI